MDLSILNTKKEVFAQIDAIIPDGANASMRIFHGKVKNLRIYLDPNKPKFKYVLNRWSSLYRNREKASELSTSLIVSLWVRIENKDYRVIPDKFITYSPILAKRKLLTYQIIVHANELEEIESNNPSTFNTLDGTGIQVYYVWELVPEYSWIPNDFVDVPLLIINNTGSKNSKIDFSVEFSAQKKTLFKVTLSYGNNIAEKIANGQTPELKIYSKGPSLAYYYDFYADDEAYKGEFRYVWISAKPAHEFYREYKEVYHYGVLISKEPTGKEKIRDLIRDVELETQHDIRGGVKSQLNSFDKSVMHNIYRGATMDHLYISGTYLADGDLDSGERVLLKRIFHHYDVKKVNFEIGIPVGAMAAIFLPSPWSAIISALALSISYSEEYQLTISGGIENDGPANNELVYVAISKYRYVVKVLWWEEYYNVPVGIYIECL